MTDKQTPPDWVLIEAAKRSGMSSGVTLHSMRQIYSEAPNTFRALCDMIERYEQPPVDRKLLCAREAMTEFAPPHADPEGVAVRAIELWESGYGA